ncbi:hypothetical protein [Mesorhizobium sp.]|uniref:hypothetical protein n=1 Tax=Mesorhizobium sp. TaxID=1871066 RepID=UPI000FE94F31|nr:hypothetical protein [Mesorhizobium sp.]RWC43939.1 MAG: hypothetical protein EOS28_12285 [Mesorhizobium sp.]RWE99539.1 MAG: hypothetical protein EOS68_11665 [Mesorhizobium sp.]
MVTALAINAVCCISIILLGFISAVSIGATADCMAIPLHTKTRRSDGRLAPGTARKLGNSRKSKNTPAKTGKPAAQKWVMAPICVPAGTYRVGSQRGRLSQDHSRLPDPKEEGSGVRHRRPPTASKLRAVGGCARRSFKSVAPPSAIHAKIRRVPFEFALIPQQIEHQFEEAVRIDLLRDAGIVLFATQGPFTTPAAVLPPKPSMS